MKRVLFSAGALMIYLTCSSSGCKHDDNSAVTPSNTTTTTPTTTGKWKVSYYFDKKDETSDYSGYVFEFNSDRTMTAGNNGVNTTGTWGERTDDGKQKFTIALNSTDSKLLELNDDWVIESKTDAEIKLKDDNNSEQLQFKKQ